MNYMITKGNAEDYEDIIDFGNYVFAIDFPTQVPKIYKNHPERAQQHHIIKEGTKIKAMVGSFPLGLKVLDHEIKMHGIGTVSVHRYARGSGYMKILMDKAMEEITALGCDMAVLGGQRQRYEYWGFTPCGINLSLNFNESNVKHIKMAMTNDYTFIEYDESLKGDLDNAVALHDSLAVHGLRDKDHFIEICNTWNSKVIFVYENELFAGYICASNDYKRISEIVLKNSETIDQVVISYMKYYKAKNLSLSMDMHRSQEFMKLSCLCEDYTIKKSANIYIINYAKVIKAFMDLKNTYSPLCEGTLIINVIDNGSFEIKVDAGRVTVEETNKPWDISLSHLDASALLFSHASFVNTTYDLSHPLVKAWFPLPLFHPNIDNV